MIWWLVALSLAVAYLVLACSRLCEAVDYAITLLEQQDVLLEERVRALEEEGRGE